MSIPRLLEPKGGKLTLAFGATAAGLAVAAFFAANLAANTPEAQNAPREPWAIRRAPRQLGLSDDQKEQIRGVLKAHAGEIEAQMQAARTGNRALREAMAAQPLEFEGPRVRRA